VDSVQDGQQIDMVNSPPYYTRGPFISVRPKSGSLGRIIECIEVIRHIRDMRLANAMKYIWRVAFGGKGDGSKNREDIGKAIWYLQDFLDNPVEGQK